MYAAHTSCDGWMPRWPTPLQFGAWSPVGLIRSPWCYLNRIRDSCLTPIETILTVLCVQLVLISFFLSNYQLCDVVGFVCCAFCQYWHSRAFIVSWCATGFRFTWHKMNQICQERRTIIIIKWQLSWQVIGHIWSTPGRILGHCEHLPSWLCGRGLWMTRRKWWWERFFSQCCGVARSYFILFFNDFHSKRRLKTISETLFKVYISYALQFCLTLHWTIFFMNNQSFMHCALRQCYVR